ncbi:nucleotidyl transferase AbiEii/AbiGii toxin family protein [Alteromonas sp. ASW11-19]|uniref:Nucleotidyl transferase AbiEii/AbiGii toxin family protein n=1 Tax=Alteromonas salexigens TaxID=2982530 RepID=A0ABT2VV26_9ALTE|nr:nucleotidyl transferase AbiEii/AbiGii toxin family protein [Alteromonas salexigens]MCU7556076.1 nucleotidyl transferase AbiEii/AbiGii toxin family protein [Alteromonas salexigens]
MKSLHHAAIKKALSQFNSHYLSENQILFGDGTRIALELDEYRKSIDIDFLCPDKASYRAVRTQVTNNSFGNLVDKPFTLPREIRADRDAVRAFINVDDITIKLEFVSFDDYQLKAACDLMWGVPIINRDSCFVTKILANADRYRTEPRKDIVDLVMMYRHWGEPSEAVWDEVDAHYGPIAEENLIYALQGITCEPTYLQKTIAVCEMDPASAQQIEETAEHWLHTLHSQP